MKKSTNNLQTGCGCIPYLVMVVMLASPVLCLANTLLAAPTPEHRAAVEAMPPDPLADSLVTWLAFGGCGAILLVVLLKSGQTVEYDPPAVDLPDALWMAAHTNLTTSIEMGEVTRDIRRGMAYLEVNNPSPTPTDTAKNTVSRQTRTQNGEKVSE